MAMQFGVFGMVGQVGTDVVGDGVEEFGAFVDFALGDDLGEGGVVDASILMEGCAEEGGEMGVSAQN
jgi:hypothetical protein